MNVGSKKVVNPYAANFDTLDEATKAGRALFAEVYARLIARGHTVEVDFLGGDDDEIPQLGAIDGFELRYKRFNLRVDNTQHAWRLTRHFYLVFEFCPRLSSLGRRRVSRCGSKSAKSMTPDALTDFVEKYLEQSIQDEQARQAKLKIEDERKKIVGARQRNVVALRQRANAGRAVVIATNDLEPTTGIVVSLSCRDAEEARAALALLDVSFPRVSMPDEPR